MSILFVWYQLDFDRAWNAAYLQDFETGGFFIWEEWAVERFWHGST